jgi:GntR family transcriptional regulator
MTTFLVPVYYQIKQTIRNWIINGEFKPGEKIPSENELAIKFGVSRLTLRAAISQLAQEKLLISKRGKGTFVSSDKNILNSYSLEFTGFMDDLFYEVSKSKTKWAMIKKIIASANIREKLDIPNEKEVICIKRVRLLREELFAYTVNYLPMEIGIKIQKKELFKKPLLKIIEQDLGIEFKEAFQTIEASFATQEVSQKMKITQGTPVLLVERIMYDKRNNPVELVKSYYLGEKHKYIMRLKSVRKGKNRWTTYS